VAVRRARWQSRQAIVAVWQSEIGTRIDLLGGQMPIRAPPNAWGSWVRDPRGPRTCGKGPKGPKLGRWGAGGGRFFA